MTKPIPVSEFIVATMGLVLYLEIWLFGILHGWGIGLPNLLGVARKEPEQVRDSDTVTMQTPRDPKFFKQEYKNIRLYDLYLQKSST